MLTEHNNESMLKWPLVMGALLSALAVIIGAFGAHALDDVLIGKAKGWYETGVTYHVVHALALFMAGLLAIHYAAHQTHNWLKAASYCFIVGMVLFSGSLYAMALTNMTSLGAITPVGGLFLIIAWLCLAVGAGKLTSRVS